MSPRRSLGEASLMEYLLSLERFPEPDGGRFFGGRQGTQSHDCGFPAVRRPVGDIRP
jgi:hypothetical protein